MPKKPKSPCRYSGCAELTETPYCDKHSKMVTKHSTNNNVTRTLTRDTVTGGEEYGSFTSRSTPRVSYARGKIY